MYNQDASATLGVTMTAKVPPKSTTCQAGGNICYLLVHGEGNAHSNYTRGNSLLHN